MAQNQNLLITIILAIVIVIAIGAYAYTTLFNPNETSDDETDNTENDDINTTNNEILLTINYQGTNYTYTLSELEEMKSVSGQGRKIKSTGDISDPYNYTGVTISIILETINISSDVYQITAIANDSYSMDYSWNESNIEVEVYDESGNVSENGSATMIVAFKEDGQYLTGLYPLRIAFIGEDDPITSSGIWVKNVTTIEVT
jgi:hypothetical protein